jgi:hypothetical protein
MKKSKSTWILASIALLVLCAAACKLPFSSTAVADDAATAALQLAQTQVGISATQTALAPAPTEAPAPAATEPALPPTLEPDTPAPGTTRYTFGNFQFDMPDYLALDVNHTIVPAALEGDEAFPGAIQPEYLGITFDGYIIPDAFHTPEIRVYPVADYMEISQSATDTFEELNYLLVNRPQTIPYDAGLPFIPFWNAGQIFNAQAKFVDFKSGSGIRFLSMYAQAFYPVDNYNIFFTYQGLSADHAYFISMVLPINSAALPMHAEDPADYEAFINSFSTYLQETSAMLNAEAPERFTPTLTVLDAMIASMRIIP